ncbi:MAG: ABC transporter permease [Firmicutes bacterium]|nr:ABC transporter permease [Bacillota bacterium]
MRAERPLDARATPAGSRRPGRGFKPLGEIPASLYTTYAAAGFLGLVAVWSLLTSTRAVDPLFLPSPAEILRRGWELFRDMGFGADVAATVLRVFLGFAAASAVALPLGILMGVYRPIEALVEPLVSFARYMPASAFIPLLILWVGVGEAEKVAVIFLGSVFSLVLMVAVHIRQAQRELVEAAYTLGASDAFVVRHVILPNAWPAIYDTLRLVLGWAWTYIIVAELVAADSGIGHVILQSQRMLNTGNIIFGILVIGVIGLVSDLVMKAAGRALFAWRG